MDLLMGHHKKCLYITVTLRDVDDEKLSKAVKNMITSKPINGSRRKRK